MVSIGKRQRQRVVMKMWMVHAPVDEEEDGGGLVLLGWVLLVMVTLTVTVMMTVTVMVMAPYGPISSPARSV